jgi:hypothetical protein
MVSFGFDLSTGDELTGLVKELRGLNKNVSKEMRGVVAEVERQLDNVLVRYTPPKPNRPIQWTSEKQRRYVMANKKLPHIRQGIQRLWITGVTERDGVYTVSAYNPSAAARWVYSPRLYRQKFLTGWGDPEKEVIDGAVKIDAALPTAVDKAIRKLK